MRKAAMWILVLVTGCARTHLAKCEEHEVTTGSASEQALPDGSTLESWLDRLTAGVEASVRWDADGSSATVSVSMGSYEADAVSLTLGECAVPLLTVDADAVASLAAPVLELAGTATAWRAELDELTSGLVIDLAAVDLDVEHEPFAGYDTVDPPLLWTFELFEFASTPGELFAVLTWSTGDNPAVEVDGMRYLRGRLFGTPGHPWTDPEQAADPAPVP